MIDRLEMFIALANARHFGKAAEAVGVSQPTLSGAVRALEDQLGVQLVQRGSRFQGLTPEGDRVLGWAIRIVGDARTLREEMKTLRHGLSGNLRLGVIPTALPEVARLTGPFLARNSRVGVTILSRTSAEILDGIEGLTLDAGITYLDNEPLGRVVQVPLYREGYRLLLAEGSTLWEGESIGWAEAADLPLCLLTADMQNRRIVSQNMAEAGRTANPPIESNSSIALLAHVATGRWASIVPAALADMFAAGSALRSIPVRDPESTHLVGLVAPLREPHTPLLAALLDEARACATLDSAR